ncbi:MAG: ABC transporter ATP-binding protein [Chloroflexales bacterium]|nr:ABC transporter ATP-binding protein [Chloroflexales bacterium]
MAQPTALALELRGASIRFGEQVGVEGLNLEVPAGTIFGLIGPSGSGKTTTVRLLTGVYKPQEGVVRVLGQRPGRGNRRLRQQIGYVPQLFTLYPNLTVWENLNFVASLYGISWFGRRKRLREILDFVELGPARTRLGRDLSGGMQRRLSLACALVHSPTLIFADEPTAGVDPVLRTKFWEHFRALRDQGRTLLVTTQYVGEVAACDLVGVMREGRLLHVASPTGLRRAALGGEVVRLVVDPQDVREASQILLRLPQINDVQRVRGEPGALNVLVERAGEALPAIFAALGDAPGVTVRVAEEYQPPFDDILVALLERAEVLHG